MAKKKKVTKMAKKKKATALLIPMLRAHIEAEQSKPKPKPTGTGEKEFRVFFTFGGAVHVKADTEEEAEDKVDEMTTDELWAIARKGFEVCSIEEVEDD